MTEGFIFMRVFRQKLLSIPVKEILVLTVMIFLSATFPSSAQVVVERSKDKAIIAGESYYIHIVKKGQTVYSISRAYGISVEQLEHENPTARGALKEGSSLRIPVKIVSPEPAGQPVPYRHTMHNEEKFIYHILNKGETIYYLSRKYQVSEQDITEANPGLDITRITVGSEIAIPRKHIEVVKTIPSDVPDSEFRHKVSSGETLSSIAREYGVSLRDLRKANRNIRFPKVGDYVIIPGREQQEKDIIEEVQADTLKETIDTVSIQFVKPGEYVHIHSLSGSIDVAVLLPFYLRENARRIDTDSSKTIKGKKEYRITSRPEDWIYPPSIEFVEMYEGILLAADTLRSIGLNINIHTYDVGNDTIEIKRLIRSGSLSGMDLIIGPVYSRNLSIVANYAREMEIPVVSPVSLLSSSPLKDNPNLFMAVSSMKAVERAIARKVADYPGHNIVLVHSSNPEEQVDINQFKKLISDEIARKQPFVNVRIKSIPFYSRSEYGVDSVMRLSKALSAEMGNIVIIASESAPVISESVMEVRNLSRKFDIKVFGYPEMRELSNIDPKFLFDLGVMVYSPYWIDYSGEDVKRFISHFRKKFYMEPSQESYAWQGYDITYYFLSGIALYGKNFIMHPQIHNPDLLHTDFDFRRKGISDGFENHKLFLIRYNNDYNLVLVKDDNREPGRPEDD